MLEDRMAVSSDIVPERLRSPSRANVCHVVVLILCVVPVLGSFLLHPGDRGLYLFGLEWPLGCALYQNLGIKCALCGLTRSFCSIAEGDFSAAIGFHLLGPVVFVFVCLQMAYRIHMLRTGGRENRKLRMAGIYSALVLAGSLLINWFVYLGGLVL